MNAKRRKAIKAINERVEEIIAALNDIRDEEQDCFDNLPEGIQESDRGLEMEDYISCLENAIESAEELFDNLDESNFE